ncbi:MAG: hypothetical protein EXQ95_05810 [Alphaproteobacteria bacterium]|nr:hypothetical protein [Alphaproteobacteria bacterium]
MSATTGDAANSAESKKPARATHFTFRHPVFSVKGGYFAYMGKSTEVGFHLPLGDMFGVAPINRIQDEFHLDPEGDDGRLLQIVSDGLRYVSTIRPGDSIPTEILDGTASWSVEERHHELATNRLDLQVWSWTKGREKVIALPQIQDRITRDPETRKAIEAGLRALAEQLGHGEGGAEQVKFQLERVRREIVYIEALRDRGAFTKEIAAGLGRYNRLYGNINGVEGEIGRARALMRMPLELFRKRFAEVDARTGQILELLRDVDASIHRIREDRDDLHFDFMAWDGLIEKWKDAVYERTEAALALIKETYRFLATNYATSVAWTLAGQRLH